MEVATKSFQDLLVWKKARGFVLGVYSFTQEFPKQEVYGLVSQFKRASISIAANIAEGCKKKGKADKLRFFNISHGSLGECQYYLILSKDLSYGETNMLIYLLNKVSKMLDNYMYKINQDLNQSKIKP